MAGEDAQASAVTGTYRRVVVGTETGYLERRVVHGSVSGYCRKHARCPVVVVPAPGASPASPPPGPGGAAAEVGRWGGGVRRLPVRAHTGDRR
jgi:hypothetical protein